MDQMHVTIDGAPVTAEPGMTILEVAQSAGLGDRIPTLCHEPTLPPYTSCFVCVVEVEGIGKLLPACSSPASEGMVIHTQSPRVTSSRQTALELLLSNHPADCIAPCRRGCPAQVDVQTYLALAGKGSYQQAIETIRRNNPLPLVCGRVCVRRCEEVCRRQILDEPVAINAVKRAVSDWWLDHPYPQFPGPDTGKRVAIVGGGPAGLAAAYFLRLAGYGVTLFEMRKKLGGMLRYGIPDYRLPQRLLDFEIQQILDLGVEVHVGVRLGTDLSLFVLRSEFDAVFLAVGAQLGSNAYIQGEGHPAVIPGVDFLVGVKQGLDHGVAGKKVAVIGGGNTAIDAARTALRLNAQHVAILYRRTRQEMPASDEEVQAADEEGIRLEFLIAPKAVHLEGETLVGLICERMRLGEPDASGRRRPVPVEGTDHLVQCDLVVTAIGQRVDLAGLNQEDSPLATTRGRTIQVDERTLATNLPGVFAGGDGTTGPAVVIDAIAHGRLAALSIQQYLEVSEPTCRAELYSVRKENFGALTTSDLPPAEAKRRVQQGALEVADRIRTFDEVETTIEEYEVRAECERCLGCGCAAAPSCELRKLAERYGVDDRISGQTVRFRVDRSHPTQVLDPNKCILCTRCVRTCGDIQGISVLGLVNRGFETSISPSLGRPLDRTDCIACGNCVEACPTGALTFKHLAQTAPPIHSVETVCTLCGEVCPMVMTSNAFGLSARSPRLADGSLGLLCAQGRYGNVEILQGERLDKPLIRQGGQLVPATWDQAIDRALGGLKAVGASHGSGSVLVSGSADLTCEEAVALTTLGREGLGAITGCLSVVASQSEVHALDPMYGTTRSTATYEEVVKASCLLVVGDDPVEKAPAAAARIRRAKRNGASIIAITSAPTRITALADVWVEARRGTSSLVLGWLLARLLRSPMTEMPPAVLAAIQQALSRIDEGQIERECGVSQDTVSRALALLTDAPGPVVAVYSVDARPERSPDGLLTLAELVEVAAGARPGSGILLTSECPNLDGIRLAGLLPASLQDESMLAASIRAGDFAGAWIVREDPDENEDIGAGLMNLEFLVVQDLFLTATAARADVVLPATTHLETGGTFVRADGRIYRTEALISPRPGRSFLSVIEQALARLDRQSGYATRQGAWRRIAAGLGHHLDRPYVVDWPIPNPTVRFLQPLHGVVRTTPRVVNKSLHRLFKNSTAFVQVSR